IIQFYNITKAGNWEEHKNILWRTQSMADFLATNKLDKQSWFDQLNKHKKTLYEARKKRVAPGLDDKIITAWNAMTICGLTDAYKVCGDAEMLAAAERNIQFLEKHLISDGIIYRSYKDKRSDVIGFLDDYAYCIHAYLKLYQVTFKESYIHKANKLIEQTLLNYFDNKEGFFNYSSQQAEQLISSKKEIFDNVIPSSNALMAQNLFQAGIIADRENWKDKAIKMCENFSALITSDPNYMSYWALVWTEMRHGMAEVVFAGDDTENLIITWHQHFLPFAILMGNNGKAELPLVQDKSAIQNKSTIYVCKNKTCKLPVHEVAEAIKQLS
ncbi:MAG TPA: thioredoxin domain-containing protein, partial [Cyclobacteriaceae bacterium]|nr:thioredoxin domain-containing protein [Cyclobacteriaceae bacterium]